MEKSTIITIIRENRAECKNKFNVTFADGHKETLRLFVSANNDVCEFRAKSTTRGHRIYTGDFTDVAPVGVTSPVVMVRKNATKIVNCLTKSGLWKNLRQQFESLLKLTDDEIKELLDMQTRWHNVSYNEMTQIQREHEAFFDARNLTCFDFYHFAQLGKKGQVISIPFNKWTRDKDRSLFAEAIEKAKKIVNHTNEILCSRRWYGSYDYSASVEDKKDGDVRAWYSAEYKNCGNGHYYLMLDERTAWFYEDD